MEKKCLKDNLDFLGRVRGMKNTADEMNRSGRIFIGLEQGMMGRR